MIMIPVNSQNIKAVGYNSNSKVLRIQFIRGVYDYINVPQSVYEEMMNSMSIGKYHLANIKNKYKYIKVC